MSQMLKSVLGSLTLVGSITASAMANDDANPSAVPTGGTPAAIEFSPLPGSNGILFPFTPDATSDSSLNPSAAWSNPHQTQVIRVPAKELPVEAVPMPSAFSAGFVMLGLLALHRFARRAFAI